MRDFTTQKRQSNNYYDLFDDYELIEASFAQQYGIRLRREDDMTWGEFTTLLAGLNNKTPLGNIVAIRAEKDPKVIKQFTAEQKRIRTEWARKQAKQAKQTVYGREEYKSAMNNFENMFKAMAHQQGVSK